MNVRRLSAALAMPCLCLAAGAAQGQSQIAGPPNPSAGADVRSAAGPRVDNSFRLQPEAGRRAAGSAMIQSWTMEGNGELGLGRFTVPNGARPRTHTERMRDGMDAETRRIAGAGMQIRF